MITGAGDSGKDVKVVDCSVSINIAFDLTFNYFVNMNIIQCDLAGVELQSAPRPKGKRQRTAG